MAMSGDGHHRHAFPTRRSPRALDTETTDLQSATEDEVAPFFVDLASLNEGQLDHLRRVGLIPPLPAAAKGGVGVRRRRGRGKAAKLLGDDDDEDEEDASDEGPTIEMLDEEDDDDVRDGSPSPPPVADDDADAADAEDDGPPFDPHAIRLLRSAHASYLTNALSETLPRGFVGLDASHPWMAYWCLHSLDLLGCFDVPTKRDGGGAGTDGGLNGGGRGLEDVEEMQRAHLLRRIVSTIEHCWTDVPLEFDAAEVANDARLRLLRDDQRTSGSDGAASTEQTLSLTGGGFGGGPGQMPHLAPTYAAVLSLCIVAGVGSMRGEGHPYHDPGRSATEALERRRLPLYAFFLTLRERYDDDGEGERVAFRMQHDGEVDVRAAYCLLAPCHLLGLLDGENENDDNENGGDDHPLRSPAIARHIAACQTYEGGFGAEPHNEAHGGYTFCSLAALRILGSVRTIDADALASWLARRQTSYEGGFCGRTNKLVDGCYSFWQGGATAVLDGWRREEEADDAGGEGGDDDDDDEGISYDEVMLQRYILLCAQDVNGGLRDKPSKPRDFYHSCYNLSGLSVAQRALEPWPPDDGDGGGGGALTAGKEEGGFHRLFGDARVNVVGRTDPVINVRVERARHVRSQRWRSSKVAGSD